MAEDPQKLKKIAAASYDYENDSRWATYWSNILIPPHMASRIDVIDHYKRRFYQRYIDPDLVVEPMASSSSSQTPKPSSTSSTSAREQPRQQNSGSSTRTTGASATPAATPSSLRWDRQTIQFSVNAWVFIVAVLAILPIVPKSLSNRAFRLAFMGSTCSSLYSIYSLYGKPRAWNLQALQVWFQSVLATKDFIYFLYCLTFVTSNLQIKFALIPVLCRTLEHAAKFLRRNFGRSSLYRKYLDEPCLWVESNTTTLGILTSHAEIGLGFLLIISLFSWQRNIIQTFMYWQILKLMYHVPATSGYHQSAWAKISQSVTPLIDRYAPFLHTPISAIQKWWFRMSTTTNLPEQQQQQRPAIYPQAVSSGTWHSSGSVGPFFIVISVIAVLAVLSCLVSRFCVGSRTRPVNIRYGDCWWWVRKRFSWCTSSHDVELGAKVAVNVPLPNKNGKSQGTETVSL